MKPKFFQRILHERLRFSTLFQTERRKKRPSLTRNTVRTTYLSLQVKQKVVVKGMTKKGAE